MPSVLHGIIGSAGGGTYVYDYIIGLYNSTPNIGAYAFTPGTGWGTKYANPATLPGSVNAISASPSDDAVAMSQATTPFVAAYQWSSAGWGTKYANPATAPAGGVGMNFHPSAAFLGYTNGAQGVGAYTWTSASGFGTKLTEGTTGTGTNADGTVDWTLSNSHAITTFSYGDTIAGYAWSASGMGTRVASPAVATGAAAGASQDILFSPNDAYITIANGYTLHPIWTTSWTGSGFGTVQAQPTGATSGGTFYYCAMHPSKTYMAFAMNNTPFVDTWPWSGSSWGTKISAPSSVSTGTLKDVAWTKKAPNDVFHLSTVTPWVQAYTWSAGSYGTKYAAPATLLTGVATSFGGVQGGTHIARAA